MIEPLSIDVEIWPLAADDQGIWLCSGTDSWRSTLPVPADSSPHGEVDLILAGHRVTDAVRLLHSTSWRAERHRVVLTYAAVLEIKTALVRLTWPDAQPIDSAALLGAVGSASSWISSDSPPPRHLDVLLHAVRHLAFLTATDPGVTSTFPGPWARHLAMASPALAGMYEPEPES